MPVSPPRGQCPTCQARYDKSHTTHPPTVFALHDLAAELAFQIPVDATDETIIRLAIAAIRRLRASKGSQP